MIGIDQLEDGSLVVIDYKTGKVSPAQWFGDRPEDPQLPLYSLAVASDLTGVSFAVLRPGEYGFKGVTETDGVLPAVRSCNALAQSRHHDSWQDLLAEWKQTIELLADEFAEGQATVKPLKYPASCEYCPLTAVCRVGDVNHFPCQQVEGGADVCS